MISKSIRALAISTGLLSALSLSVLAQDAPRQEGSRSGQSQRAGMNAQRQGQRFATLQDFMVPPNQAMIVRNALTLGLSDQQVKDIKALYVRFNDKTKAALAERAPAMKAAIDAVSGPSPSRSAFDAANAKVAKADKVILDAEYDFWTGFNGILTAEQRTKLQEMRRQTSQRMGQFQQRGQGGRQGGQQREGNNADTGNEAPPAQ